MSYAGQCSGVDYDGTACRKLGADRGGFIQCRSCYDRARQAVDFPTCKGCGAKPHEGDCEAPR